MGILDSFFRYDKVSVKWGQLHHGESDRSAALLAAALLDAQLESLFRARLKHHQDRLLGFDGPLASFSTRIKMARALDWIDEEVERDLDVIRNIRNRFAHSFEQNLTFEDVEIEGWCSSLLTIQAYLAGFDRAKDRLHRNFSLQVIAAWRGVMQPPRMRYLVATNWLAQHLKEMMDATSTVESLVSQVMHLGQDYTVRVQATATVGPAVASPAPDA
jgi:DNA-binding MltR family transcriptional regulator